jgi:hypothetical protein
VEISASQAAAWGTITGTLSAQTDLNTALSGKVPTSRTLTINGTTQDLSADRTFTISTGITIGTTAITSGTVGRVLFEGTGNVVQESANLFWDNTNGRLGIGVTPNQSLSVHTGAIFGNAAFGAGLVTTFDGTSISMVRGGCTTTISSGFGGTASIGTVSNAAFRIFTANTVRIQINDNGNVGIKTTVDAGFTVDINGTARVNGSLTFQAGGSNLIGPAGTAFTMSSAVTLDLTSASFRFYTSYTSGGVSNAAFMVTPQLYIGTSIPTFKPSAQLELDSTTKGFLPPRMTTTQKNAIASPATGLVVYDTTLNKLCLRTASAWETITSL